MERAERAERECQRKSNINNPSTTLTVGESCIVVQSCGGIKPVVDMSALAFSFDSSQETRIFDIRSYVEFVPPAEQDHLVVEQNDRWASIKVISQPGYNPNQTSGDQPTGENVSVVATAEDLIQLLDDPDVSSIELAGNIDVDCSGSTLSRDVTFICGNYALALSGCLTIENGGLYRFEFAEGEGRATVDMTELTINATAEVGKTKSDNIVFWRKRIGVDVLFDEANEHLSRRLCRSRTKVPKTTEAI